MQPIVSFYTSPTFQISKFLVKPRFQLVWLMHVLHRHLESDDTLPDRTSLDVNEIMSLIDLCLNATYFGFRGRFYQQVFGTAMGSPVSVVVANLVMEDIEQQAISTFPRPPKF